MDLILGINGTEGFKTVVATIQAREDYVRPQAFAIGLAHISNRGNVLSVRFPHVNLNENPGSAAIFSEVIGQGSSIGYLNGDQMDLLSIAFAPFENDGGSHANIDAVKAVATMSRTMAPLDGTVEPVIAIVRDLQVPPTSAVDAYLRLHLLSYRKVVPNSINLDGVFGLLTNCAWTEEEGPVEAEHFDRFNLEYMAFNGVPLTVRSVDKFPRMTDFVVPSGVRIAHADNVRLGAYLAPGTVVMHAGFVNFNAGTLGKCMIEGRISSGVVVDEGSDLGGGASTMGTLSGGGKERVRIGKRSLVGANAGIGIVLGDDCKVEAGLYVTAGTKVRVFHGSSLNLPDTKFPGNPEIEEILGQASEFTSRIEKVLEDQEAVLAISKELYAQGMFDLELMPYSAFMEKSVVSVFIKGKILSGKPALTYRRNSKDGAVEAVPTAGAVVLNSDLHKT